MTKENLLMFWGWSKDDSSYRGIKDSAPKDWDIHTLNFEDLMESGWIDKIGENVTRFLDENKLDKVNSMGHSMGGALALTYAYLHPERVDRLFLLDSSGIYGNESFFKLVANFFKSHSPKDKTERSENLKAMIRAFKRPLANLKLAQYAYRVDLQEEAGEINVPTVIIWGEDDHLNPLWQGKKLNTLIKNSRLIILPKMDHNWPLHAPELFWENVEK